MYTATGSRRLPAMSRPLPAWTATAAAITATLAACLGIQGYRNSTFATQVTAWQQSQAESALAARDEAAAQRVHDDQRPPIERLNLAPRPADAVLVQRWRWWSADAPDQADPLALDSDRLPVTPVPVLGWMDRHTLATAYRRIGGDATGTTYVPIAGALPDRMGPGGTDQVMVIAPALEAQVLARQADHWRTWLAGTYARRAWQHQQTAIRYQCDASDAADHGHSAIIAMIAVIGVGAFAAWGLWQDKRQRRSADGW